MPNHDQRLACKSIGEKPAIAFTAMGLPDLRRGDIDEGYIRIRVQIDTLEQLFGPADKFSKCNGFQPLQDRAPAPGSQRRMFTQSSPCPTAMAGRPSSPYSVP